MVIRCSSKGLLDVFLGKRDQVHVEVPFCLYTSLGWYLLHALLELFCLWAENVRCHPCVLKLLLPLGGVELAGLGPARLWLEATML